MKNISDIKLQHKCFALWRNPNSTTIYSILDEGTGDHYFYLFPFDKESHSIKTIQATKVEVLEKGLQSSIVQSETENWAIPSNVEDYHEKFSVFHQELNSDSEIEKLVLSRKIQVKTQFKAEEVFSNLCLRFPSAFVYLARIDKDTYWLAATPEVLIKQKGEDLETMALAGTKNANKQDDVLWTKKEKDEHQFVVDYIVNELEGDCQDIICEKEPKTVGAGFVWHLLTPIKAKISSNSSSLKIAGKLHPTPAVCGTPKNKAFDFIKSNENYDREYYTGFVGLSTPSSTSFYVNLRCAKMEQNKVSVFVGGGLVKQSNMKDEWNEILQKSKTIISCL
jgi:isochorismate synthase